jgi:hypothetical protein
MNQNSCTKTGERISGTKRGNSSEYKAHSQQSLNVTTFEVNLKISDKNITVCPYK